MFFFLAPGLALAADLSKGLDHSAENLNQKASFLKGGALLSRGPANVFPVPLYMLRSGGSLKFDLNTDKVDYRAGETVKCAVSAQNDGFTETGKKFYYLWAAGNFSLEVYRLSDQVKDGEWLISTERVYPADDIVLLQNQRKDFNFSWRIPENARAGTYELRVYPESDRSLFRGTPWTYRSLLKSRITVLGDEDKEEKVEWDVGGMTLDGENIHSKEKVIYLDNDKEYAFSVPLRNFGSRPKKLGVIKQVFFETTQYPDLLDSEREEIDLEPGEEKIISYKITPAKTRGKAEIMVSLGLFDPAERLPEKKGYFEYSPGFPAGEKVVFPFNLKGNVELYISGAGIMTARGTAGFVEGSYLTPFVEIRRSDPLFYFSTEEERAAEDNLKVNLALSDRSGNKVDEFGYEGPSWDRAAAVEKRIQLKRDYDYLKLTAVLESQGRGEIQRKELEYSAPLVPRSGLEKIKALWENYKMIFLAAAGVAFLVLLFALYRLYRLRKS